MFDDLDPKEIETAINLLIEEGFTETPYSVWYEGNLVPPKTIIRKTYKLIGETIPRHNFNTNEAQRVLLKKGFPIVDTEEKDGFFTKKDLDSFKSLIRRTEYDKLNSIDKNIGYYLNQVSWEKTKKWAKELENKGWVVKGRKNWNIQTNNKTGQDYKQYTWYRVYPIDFKQNLLYYTIGIHTDGQLLYKLDIHRDDPYFTTLLKSVFDNLRDEVGAGWQLIPIDEIKNYSWERLVQESHNFFQKHLADYYKIEKELWKTKRLMRLTWNENDWHFPSFHKWSKENQLKKNKLYESRYGFAPEEWLFNPRYRLNGFQYGYIRGIDKMKVDEYLIDELFLYTIDPISKCRYIIGKLKQVEIIEGYDEELDCAAPVFELHKEKMINELKAVEADWSHFRRNPFLPNVKFKWSEAELYQTLLEVDVLNSDRYTRFMPYIIENELDELIQKDLEVKKLKLKFIKGEAKSVDQYSKTNSGGKSDVTRNHSAISRDLGKYLKKVKGINKDNISIELTKVGSSTIDVLLLEKEGYSLFEIKTNGNTLMNIRLALGQLFEYAFLDNEVKIKKLIIVGPAELTGISLKYFKTIQKIIKKPLEYWAYTFEDVKIESKFTITK
ncbi:MAG: hypothetical protein KDD32_02535 [Bacteroidetes bacterium]|nr:hypothetical protein [Bacteroidota bacterium]